MSRPEQRPSTCTCGEPLKWMTNAGGAFYPPFEDAGYLYVEARDSGAIKMRGYKPHDCPYVVSVEGLVPQVLSTEDLRQMVWEDALKRACPKQGCKASRGVECWNLVERAKGNEQHVRWPHEERRSV